jgi:hypothetical protein
MNLRLTAEFRRLYGLTDQVFEPGASRLALVDGQGCARAMVLSLRDPADWSVLSAVWRGVQSDLALPAPAIAVNGVDAYELWFSLAAPVPVAQAVDFLQGLCERYLAEVKPQRLQMRPSGADASAQSTPLIPAQQGDSGHWSAFVAPDLPAVFGDEPVLDLPPGEDAQAELLSRLASIRLNDFEVALSSLRPAAAAPSPFEPVSLQAPRGTLLTGPYDDPKRFLHDVMNDGSLPLAARIEAAKALLGS